MDQRILTSRTASPERQPAQRLGRNLAALAVVAGVIEFSSMFFDRAKATSREAFCAQYYPDSYYGSGTNTCPRPPYLESAFRYPVQAFFEVLLLVLVVGLIVAMVRGSAPTRAKRLWAAAAAFCLWAVAATNALAPGAQIIPLNALPASYVAWATATVLLVVAVWLGLRRSART